MYLIWGGIKIHYAAKTVFFSDVADKYTYFVHSYYVDTDSQYITTTADYGIKVPGIVERGNVYGMQFHPEKSGNVGLDLLRTFGNIIVKKIK